MPLLRYMIDNPNKDKLICVVTNLHGIHLSFNYT